MEQDLVHKKILVLYTAHTYGHQRMAENIAWWLRASGATVELREVLKSSASPLVQKYLQLHIWVNTHAPWIWKFLYQWGFWFSMPLRLPVAWFNRKGIEQILSEVVPDVVITTQTSPSAVMSVVKRRGVFKGLWGIAFSDYHFHRYWVYPRADFYLTNIPEQHHALAALGIPSDRVLRIGMALPPVAPSGSDVRVKLRVSEHDKVLLVGSGTLGVALPEGLVDDLAKLRANYIERTGQGLTVIFLSGRNEKLYTSLVNISSIHSWVIPVSFYNPLRDIYAISDVMISKPGGLTIAETVQQGLPVYVTHYLPGQEELNIDYLRSRGLITVVDTHASRQWISSIIEELISQERRHLILGAADLQELMAPHHLHEIGGFIARLFHKRS